MKEPLDKFTVLENLKNITEWFLSADKEDQKSVFIYLINETDFLKAWHIFVEPDPLSQTLIFDPPGLPSVIEKMKEDLLFLEIYKIITIDDGKPNFHDARLAIALFDIWHKKYMIVNYDKSPDKIISMSIKVKNIEPKANTITIIRSRMDHQEYKNIISELLNEFEGLKPLYPH